MRPYLSYRQVLGIAFAIFATFGTLLTTGRDARAEGFKFLQVKVVDPEGQPLADVPVEISIDAMKFPMPTDEKGIVAVNVPAGDEGELKLSVQHPGYMAQGARWGKGRKTPDQFTIPMKKGAAIGGVVHDEAGKPIAGVKIKANIVAVIDLFGIDSGEGKLQPTLSGEIAVTDADGRWQTDMAPKERVELQLMFSHPDYVSDRGYSFRGGTWEELKAQKNIVVMDKGLTIAGKVVDSEDEPIAGAQVAIGARYESQRVVIKTNEEGNFEIPRAGEGSTSLTVSAAGFAPETKGVSLSKGMKPFKIELNPGNTVRMRVIDNDGEPIVGGRIEINEWRGTQNLEEPKRLTDDEGRWEWRDAPADEVKYNIGKQGYFSVNEVFSPSEEERIITLLPVVVVKGYVIDKETRKPIDSFRYVEGAWWEPSYDSYVLQSHRVQAGKQGRFRFPMSSACVKFCIRVDADGYRPTVSREIFPNEGEISLDFEMEKGTGPSGVVVSPDGKPAEGAELALATAQQGVYLDDGTIQDSAALARVVTDAKGQFALPFADGKFAVVVTHDAGWAELDGSNVDRPLKIKLSPWSTISGRSLRGTELVAGETILFHIQRPYDPEAPRVHWSYQTETSSNGAFEFQRVRSGLVTVQRYIPYAKTGANGWMSVYSHGVQIDPQPGEMTLVQIGGGGCHLQGKLSVAEADASAIDWNMACVQLTRKKSKDAKSEAPESYGCVIAQDGSFEIFDVVPGSYDVHVTVYPVDAATTGWNQIADLKTTCEVTSEPSDEILDLGTYTVTTIKPQN